MDKAAIYIQGGGFYVYIVPASLVNTKECIFGCFKNNCTILFVGVSVEEYVFYPFLLDPAFYGSSQ